ERHLCDRWVMENAGVEASAGPYSTQNNGSYRARRFHTPPGVQGLRLSLRTDLVNAARDERGWGADRWLEVLLRGIGVLLGVEQDDAHAVAVIVHPSAALEAFLSPGL